MPTTLTRLSKSRFTAGVQCHKQLWWRAHEPDAPELKDHDPATELVMEQGKEIGALARAHVPGGLLIDLPHYAIAERAAATKAALARGAAVIYEASFLAGDVYCAVDILERVAGSPRYTVIEVKSGTRVKPEHIADVAIQTWVARQAGVNVTRAELMHLNSECVFPNLANLFVREEVTPLVESYQLDIPAELAAQFAMLADDAPPETAIGPHCTRPYDCPFIARCWNDVPEHHVTTLYSIGGKAWELLDRGHETVLDLPADFRLSDIRARQVTAVRQNALVVAPGLAAVLDSLARPIAYLDFETVGPAVPAWNGCTPYHGVPVQFSCHTEYSADRVTHSEWLAEGPDDPRPAIAAALLAACRDAKTVLMYTPFERTQIRKLAVAVPELRDQLLALDSRLVDLASIVRAHVYHPLFHGSFSIKDVLPALVPELCYDDLAVQDGQVASALLKRMLLDGEPSTEQERAVLRRNLRAYCEMDTLAMVRLVQALRTLAHSSPSPEGRGGQGERTTRERSQGERTRRGSQGD